MTGRFRDHVGDPRRRRGTAARARVEAGIRGFLVGRGYLETPTPLLVRSPGMEPHIRPIATSTGAFLPTSPELAMKKLLVGGLARIFQLAPAFRHEPTTPTHSPEFTLLEFYAAEARLEDLMAEVEGLVHALAREVDQAGVIRYQGRAIATAPPWPRLAVRALFLDHVGVDLGTADRAALAAACDRHGEHVAPDDGWDELFFRLWLARVEPALPLDRACFVHGYPPSQAALAVVEAAPDGTRWARRFEVFAGGLELGNAFEELTDPVEQRRRFEHDRAVRARAYGDAWPASPIDEDFLAALAEGMPPASGIAIGVDRLVMLLADEPDLAFTRWLPAWDG